MSLSGEEVGEPLTGEPVDVVDRVALTGQRVHEHARTSRHSSLRDLETGSTLDKEVGVLWKRRWEYFGQGGGSTLNKELGVL